MSRKKLDFRADAYRHVLGFVFHHWSHRPALVGFIIVLVIASTLAEVMVPVFSPASFVPVRGEKLSAAEQAQPASLLQPEGSYGPAFLTTKNYFVIKEYNFSDLYVLFVGHLSDRMVDGLPFASKWSASTQLRSRDVEAMQRHLTRLGLYRDKIDGKAGMLTRAALGAFQKSAGLQVDCWPSEAVLRAMTTR